MVKTGNLKHAEASARAKRLSSIAYSLFLTLPGEGETYTGLCDVSFKLAPAEGAPLFLDFACSGALELIEVNGDEVPADDVLDRVRARIALPETLLRRGDTNTVRTRFSNRYDREGEGLHAFDAADERARYVYTDMEPYNAHRVLPCFDQPDCRATLRLVVNAPPGWTVRANSPVLRKGSGERTVRHEFAPTPPISTYLFCVVAGPLVVVEDAYVSPSTGRTVPLALLCRRTLEQALLEHRDELFALTKSFMAWYEEFFACSYPFAKYDQAFCPEYNHGAMENVGLVTFSERYLYRDDRATASQRAFRADTVAHEMAHMWFGDLVSPAWWDSLWLNESFATFMAAFAVSQAAGSELAQYGWIEFNADMQKAFQEDQLPTTHPVCTPVDDTDSTFLNFDYITYSKGAQVIRQLVYVLGVDAFRAGMRGYFAKHKWQNATIDDFVRALNAGALSVSAKPLPDDWIRLWILEAGINTIESVVDASLDGTLRSLVVRQSACPTNPTLRQHRMQAEAYDFEGQMLTLRRRKAVSIEGEVTDVGAQLEIVGEKRPAFLWLNSEAHGYAKVLLDDQSRQFFLEHGSELPSALTRQQVWIAVLADLSDARGITMEQFVRAVMSNCPEERAATTLKSVLDNLASCIAEFSTGSQQARFARMTFDAAMQIVNYANEVLSEGAQLGDAEIVWARYAVQCAKYNKESVQVLFDLLTAAHPAAWLDQGMRWSVLQAACAWGIDGAADAVESECARDTSDRGSRASLTCAASVFDMSSKQESWARYLEDNSKSSLHELRADMEGFWWPHQKQEMRNFASEFFRVVRGVVARRSLEYSADFLRFLMPWYPTDATLRTEAEELLKSLSPEETVLERSLREWLDSVDRANRVMALSSC